MPTLTLTTEPPVFTIKFPGNTMATLTLEEYRSGYLLRLLQVPPAHRRYGNGTRLLQECCAWADKKWITLYLEIVSNGPMSNGELEAWYKRFGFRPCPDQGRHGQGKFRRLPNPLQL